jgi:YidC/Oxa1 family membrane protein insertase
MFLWPVYVAARWPQKPKTAVATDHQLVPATSAGTTNGQPEIGPVTNSSAKDWGPEETADLTNELVHVMLTNRGGAIKYVELLKHPEEGNLLVRLNGASHESVLDLSGWDGGWRMPYTIDRENDAVVMRRQLISGARVERRYTLSARPYRIELRQTVTNPTDQPLRLPEYRLNVGTSAPTSEYAVPTFISASWLDHTRAYHQVNVYSFDEGSFLGFVWAAARTRIESTPSQTPILWAAAKNQFFALLLTPPDHNLIQNIAAEVVQLPDGAPKGAAVPRGVQTDASFGGFELPAGGKREDAFELYAGPKNYQILSTMTRGQAYILDYGWTWWVIVPLLNLLDWVHGTFFSAFKWGWGWTIVVVTVLIKLALWPLQSAANHSMKKMQALQPKVNALREKYGDDPQKLNAQMLDLYREYGVNPLGGCLPMLVQLPIFIGFYFMLDTAVQFRGESFLWIHDLTKPDTVVTLHFFGVSIPINPLPLIMTASTVLLMRMTPQATDNPQMKMMQWMPVLFLFILYNFAAALALYWTINNLISIIQTYRNLRKPLPELKRVPKPKWAALK